MLSDLARKARINAQDAQQLVYCADFLGLNTRAWFSKAEKTEIKGDVDPAWLAHVDELIKARIEARKKGHAVSETRLQDGSIRVTIRVGGAA